MPPVLPRDQFLPEWQSLSQEEAGEGRAEPAVLPSSSLPASSRHIGQGGLLALKVRTAGCGGLGSLLEFWAAEPESTSRWHPGEMVH